MSTGTMSMVRLMPLQEVAGALGVSIYTVRRLVDSEAIPAVRIGSRVMVSTESVEKIVREGVPRHKSAKAGKAKR